MNDLRGYLIHLAQFLKSIIIIKNERKRELVASLSLIDQYGFVESWLVGWTAAVNFAPILLLKRFNGLQVNGGGEPPVIGHCPARFHV